MEREQALTIVNKKIAGPRYEHTKRVAATAEKLAVKYGADVEKTVLAAIFHDYAKLLPIKELKEIISDHQVDPRLLDYHPELWHGPAGAVLVREEIGINDEDIFNAIRYHTTGRAGMSLVEKIIYIADYIEPGRQFHGLDEVRLLADTDLDMALKKSLGNTIKFLIDKSAPIFPDTFEAYNAMSNK
ncbi:HD domain-containing protein [Siminovitchia acidinfaciens]|uniref:bis(5'-nucleosyl)-tetraphosphatase (symmetrical) n=1 Tax=Siminovitchia acidinfaciens TaxID=2321395 RepID=A0A429XYR9_9BACI|nr:bis(5'-nucleosyl)-tetraphosphatase (symmetrical) YqeK [Siminovitchia acidinfaciens]RST73886.1 HD domain-containing protein [Siminovitchia acidinfaciens]